jgi:hypothetical protein
VHQDQFSILSGADIQLNIIHAQLNGRLNRGNAVLGMMLVLGSMGDYKNLANQD